MVSDPLVMPLALELLDCYRQELAKLADPPMHIGLRPGAVVDFLVSRSQDECCEGLAWVRPASFYPTGLPFPSQIESVPRTGITAWAVTLELGAVQCAPTPDENSIPSDYEWAAVTQNVMDAAAAMRRAICCFTGAAPIRRQQVIAGTWQPVDVEGGCVGGILPVTIQGPNCDCTDAGPTSS